MDVIGSGVLVGGRWLVVGVLPYRERPDLVAVFAVRHDGREWATGLRRVGDPSPEWSCGHYFTDRGAALDDLVARAGLRVEVGAAA
jgi:hypothetical protein